ncbi:hypothetical protein ACTFIZ_002529 [Dictyostelium cf. discoideum]
MKIIFKVLIIISILIEIISGNFLNCGGNNNFEIGNVTVSTKEIENNEYLILFTIDGILKETIYDGNIFTIITDGPVTLMKEKKSFCKSDHVVSCPSGSGEIKYTFNLTMPITEKTPKHQILYSTVWFTDQIPNQIGCFNINFSL